MLHVCVGKDAADRETDLELDLGADLEFGPGPEVSSLDRDLESGGCQLHTTARYKIILLHLHQHQPAAQH